MKTFQFLIILFFPSILFSQGKDWIIVSDYIEIMNNKLSTKIDVNNNIEILKALENDIEFTIKPNIDYRLETSVY
mgnify:CR=1 FL=1